MAQELKIRRGSTAQNDVFTGAEAELSLDTERNEVRVHNGVAAGGFPLNRRFDTLADLASFAGSIGSASQAVVGDQAFDVAASAATDHQLVTANGDKIYVDKQAAEVEVSATMTLRTAAVAARLPETVFKQANSAELSTIIDVGFLNGTEARIASLDLHVDGNRDNNTAAVTGILVDFLKRGQGAARLGASNCDTGIRITDQVEYLHAECHVDACGTGVLIDTDDSQTPDELMLDVTAHNCTTFFTAQGTDKMSGIVRFACEGSGGNGAEIKQGWWQVSGILRGCCTDTAGVGLLIDETSGASVTPYVSGDILISGGSDTNCTWAADIQDGELEALTVRTAGSYAAGVRIGGGVEGSARIIQRGAPASGIGLELGDGDALTGFRLLPGTRIVGGANVTNVRQSILEFSHLVGTLTIGSGSFDNTIYIPRRQAETITITNNRTQEDNKVVFRGSYTLAELNALNGGTLFKGMEAEHSASFDGARMYYDGDTWVPSDGFIADGTATITSGNTVVNVTHGLGFDPGEGSLSVRVAGGSNWLTCAASKFESQVTGTVVQIKVDADPTADIDFEWTIRKVH